MLPIRVSCHGSIEKANAVEEVWTFVLTNASIRDDEDVLVSQKLKIVACKVCRPPLATL